MTRDYWDVVFDEIDREKPRIHARRIANKELDAEEAANHLDGWNVVRMAGVSGEAETPRIGHRADGSSFLYAGKVNTVFGDSEGGKTWLCLHVAAQELVAGRNVAYIDYEDSPAGIKSRLLALGVPVGVVDDPRRLLYFNPSSAMTPETFEHYSYPWLDPATGDDLRTGFAECSLVVVDAMTEALSAAGLSSVSDVDVATWFNSFAKPIAELGPAVVVIDHMNLSDKGRVTGSQHKKSAVDGASVRVKVAEQFAPGKGGRSHLYVAKDRPGGVRAVSEGEKSDFFGTFVIPDIVGPEGAHISDPAPATTEEDKAAAAEHLLRMTIAELEAAGVSIAQQKVIDAFREGNEATGRPKGSAPGGDDFIRKFVRDYKATGHTGHTPDPGS